MRSARNESRIADALYDGELTASDLARRLRLGSATVRAGLDALIGAGEVESRLVPDRSGEPGRVETRYSLARTQRKRA